MTVVFIKLRLFTDEPLISLKKNSRLDEKSAGFYEQMCANTERTTGRRSANMEPKLVLFDLQAQEIRVTRPGIHTIRNGLESVSIRCA